MRHRSDPPSGSIRRGAPTLIVALILTTTGIASAAPRARLVVERTGAAEECPDGGQLARAVAERLGRQAFADSAETSLEVAFDRRTDGGYRALVTQRDRDGRVTGERALEDDATTCADLGEVVALTLSVLLESTATPKASREPAPPQVEALPVERPKPAEPPPERSHVTVRAEGTVGIGLGPAPAPGAVLGVGLRASPWSIDLEGFADLGSERTDRFRATLRGATLVPCRHIGPLGACLVVGAGAMTVEGLGSTNPRTSTGAFVDAGLRVALSVPLGSHLSVAAHADGRVPFTRITAGLGPEDVWTSGPLWTVVGAGLGYSIR